jgi:hypothetical protein
MASRRLGTALAGFAAAFLVAASAWAQAPQNLRGEVKAVAGNKVTLAERGGETVTLNLKDEMPIGVLVPAKAEDLAQGKFIAITAMPRSDGKLQARVIQFFPPNVRPAPGHRPWDAAPGSTMTNADIAGVVSAGGGNEIKVKYQGGEQTVVTGPDTQFVAVAPPDKSQLKPGAQAFAVGQKQPDGSYNVVRISIGKDGLKPMM